MTLFNIFTNEERIVEDVGAVVLVGSRKPEDTLFTELSGKVPVLKAIGDALSPRSLFEASYEGRRAAMEL